MTATGALVVDGAQDYPADRRNEAERTAEAVVVEILPSALLRVRLEGEHELIVHLPSTQRANFARLRVGDRVRVALSVMDRTRGRVLELLTKGLPG